MAQLRDGADFAELAREHSTDTDTASSGGALGPWQKGDLVAPVDDVVEKGTDGALLGPVASPFGWHLLLRQAPATLRQARATITEALIERSQDAAVTTWLTAERLDADIDVRDDLGDWDPTTGTVIP